MSIESVIDDNKSTPVELWRKALLSSDANIQQAIRNLDASSLQIILVESADDTLVGTITDGDIRRGLLRGLDMHSPIDSIIKREAMVAPPLMSRHMVPNLMQANKINALPVVDESGRIVGLPCLMIYWFLQCVVSRDAGVAPTVGFHFPGR